MRTRLPRRSRPPVRLISYRTAPFTVDRALAPAEVRPRPFRQRPRMPPPRPLPRPPLRAEPSGEASREVDLAVAAVVIAQAFAEVIAGIRPLHHLAGRATPEVYDMLARTLPVDGSARHHAGRTLRVRVPLVQEPAQDVAEVCAVVFTEVHAQALALRLERLRGRWRCGAVETTISPRQFRAHPAQRPGTAA